jgi:aspartate/methionine/tyrosine aminotransferase
VAQLIGDYVTPRTAAIYFTTPNNPDGKVLDRRVLAGIAEVAKSADLWVLADEVYEDYAFDGREHVSIASLPGMAERTLTVFSFSKSYGQAGLRVGYVVGPEGPMAALRKLSNHSIYNVPVAMQRAALVALREGSPFLLAARAAYSSAREAAVARWGAPGWAFTPPRGEPTSSSISAPASARTAARSPCSRPSPRAACCWRRAMPSGKDYARFARLCYTAMTPARLAAGLDRFVELLGR